MANNYKQQKHIFFVDYQRLNIVYLARCNYTCSVLNPITRSQKKNAPIDGEPLMWFHSPLNHAKACFFRLVVGFSISERLMSQLEYVVSSNDQPHVIYIYINIPAGFSLCFPMFSICFHGSLDWFKDSFYTGNHGFYH